MGFDHIVIVYYLHMAMGFAVQLQSQGTKYVTGMNGRQFIRQQQTA